MVLSLSHVWLLQPHGLRPTRLLCPWDFPSKNIGVGCHFFLQGIFLTQGSKPHLASFLLAGRLFTTSTTWPAYKFWSCWYAHPCGWGIDIILVVQIDGDEVQGLSLGSSTFRSQSWRKFQQKTWRNRHSARRSRRMWCPGAQVKDHMGLRRRKKLSQVLMIKGIRWGLRTGHGILFEGSF